MTLRRLSWSTCLCQLSPLRTRQDPPLRWIRSGAVERRRHLASAASNSPHGFTSLHPPLLPSGSLLGNLLAALRTGDAAATSKAFFAWTEALRDTSAPGHGAAVEQFMNVSSPVLSEIIRGMDPIRNPELDVSHGLNITQGQAQFTDAGKLMDHYGVRLHHRRVLQGMMTVMELRENARFALRPADFDVFLRCVGAAVDYQMAPVVFGCMDRHKLIPNRTSQTWIEFLKARFMLDPMYYSFDRARVVVNARELITHADILQGQTDKILRMDRIRHSTNAFMRLPWNRRQDEVDEEVTRRLRRSGENTGEYRSFWQHFVRTQLYPDEATEELMCTAIMGFSRSSDRRAILDMILKHHYGIDVDEESHAVSGGKDFMDDSPLRPTTRLLSALVEAFGAMSEISLGMQLVDFVSQRYDVPIPSEVWSNLLNWSYLCASKKLQTMRELYGDGEQTRVDAQDVIHVWNIMTSDPYNIQPSFEDLDIHIKTLIITRRLGEAVALIRESAMPYYETLSEEYETSVFDEILFKDATLDPSASASTTISRAAHRRRQAETRKDFAFNRIASWFDDILSTASRSRQSRKGRVPNVHIPNLVRDFGQFFLTGIRYRTSTGEVVIRSNDEAGRFRWVSEGRVVRNTLPTKNAAATVSPNAVDENGAPRTLVNEETGERFENPDFKWPTNHEMRIMERKKWVRPRVDDLVRPPSSEDGEEQRRKWWGRLEMQLMI